MTGRTPAIHDRKAGEFFQDITRRGPRTVDRIASGCHVWSSLPGGNARFPAGMSLSPAARPRRPESRRCRLKARSTHPCVLLITYERLRGEMIRILTLVFSIALVM